MLVAGAVFAETPSGRWDGAVTIGALRVPLTLQFEGIGPTFSASIVSGDTRITSSAGSFDGRKASAEFEQSAVRLDAVLGEGELKGTIGNAKTGMHSFKATPYCTCGFVGEAGPDISGMWDLGDGAGRLSVRRVGEDTIASISRSGGETGPFAGRFDGAAFELSYFDGQRGAVIEIEPRKDGGLDVSWMEPGVPAKQMKAVRAKRQQ